jgi:hypothetical protein
MDMDMVMDIDIDRYIGIESACLHAWQDGELEETITRTTKEVAIK